MLHLIPRPVHRALMPVAHSIRHVWRKVARPQLRGVTVIARNDANEVLMIQHSYAGSDWSLPSGGCRRNEAPADAAKREFREELNCELTELALVAELSEELSGAPHTGYIFTARVDGEPSPDGREVIAARFFDPARLPDKISGLTCKRLEAGLPRPA